MFQNDSVPYTIISTNLMNRFLVKLKSINNQQLAASLILEDRNKVPNMEASDAKKIA